MGDAQHRLLVVDVDDSALIQLQCVLENSGYDTTVTWDVNEALARLRREHFDVFLLGHHPPQLDAFAVLRKLSGQSCPSIVLRWPEHPFEDEYMYALGATAVVPRVCKVVADRLAELLRSDPPRGVAGADEERAPAGRVAQKSRQQRSSA